MSFNIIIIIIIIIIILKNVCNILFYLPGTKKKAQYHLFYIYIYAFSEAFIQSDSLYIYSQYVCSLGIEPTTFTHFLCSKGGSTISWIIFCLSFYHFHIVFLHFWIFIFITLSILYIKKWHTIYNRRYYNGSPSHYIASKP